MFCCCCCCCCCCFCFCFFVFFALASNSHTCGHSSLLPLATPGLFTFQSGRLKAVQGMGWYLQEADLAQVSFNLADYKQTGMHLAFEECMKDAKVPCCLTFCVTFLISRLYPCPSLSCPFTDLLSVRFFPPALPCPVLFYPAAMLFPLLSPLSSLLSPLSSLLSPLLSSLLSSPLLPSLPFPSFPSLLFSSLLLCSVITFVCSFVSF